MCRRGWLRREAPGHLPGSGARCTSDTLFTQQVKAIDPMTSALPAQPTPMLGREGELETARGQLQSAEVRLLTLVGPGGVGKTRLAIAVAESLLGHPAFPDGVWFVDLAPLRDPALVPSEIARTLGVIEAEDQPVLEMLQMHLANRRLLLALDNVEHLLAAAPEIARLLGNNRGLTVLATSREPLRLRWERTLPLGPLPVPDPDPRHLPPLEELARIPAVALFLDRARAVRPQFSLTPENAPAVALLCVRLDGLPLAIELAAARAALLGPAAILSRLERHLPLPRTGGHDAPERHQTIRGAISWSYDLLSPEEQALFRSVGVFAGGWTLDAAEAVCHQADVLDGLASLADKSLVQVTVQPDGEPRFRLLETVREFALEQLAQSADARETGRRHAAHFLALAETAASQLAGPDQRSWVARLEKEHDNLRAALGWLLENKDAERAQHLCSLLGFFWWIGGYLAEGRRWLSEALALDAERDSPSRPAALVWYGILAYGQGDTTPASAPLDEALAVAHARGDRRQEAFAITVQGLVAWRRGDTAQAIQQHRQALRIVRDLGDPWFLGDVLFHLGMAELEHDPPAATEALSESVEHLRIAGGPHHLILSLGALADALAQQGRDEEAAKHFQEALNLALEGADPITTAGLATLVLAFLAEQGRAKEALPFLMDLEAYAESVGYRQTPVERAAAARADRAARTQVGEERHGALRGAGRALPPGEIIRAVVSLVESKTARVRSTTASAPTQPESPARTGRGLLSPREEEVLALVAEGLSNKEIARRLIVSESTAKYHVTSLFNKLGANTRAQVVTRAASLGLLSPQ
jgi:predicted ATPase/DNA-binding CsgD family transcriptional regulator